MEQKQIHIVGHKNPDTDSVCSALAYAYLKNTKEPERYIAIRAGAINNETKRTLILLGSVKKLMNGCPLNTI